MQKIHNASPMSFLFSTYQHSLLPHIKTRLPKYYRKWFLSIYTCSIDPCWYSLSTLGSNEYRCWVEQASELCVVVLLPNRAACPKIALERHCESAILQCDGGETLTYTELAPTMKKSVDSLWRSPSSCMQSQNNTLVDLRSSEEQ